MHEIAVPAATADALVKLPASSLTEISHWGVFASQHSPAVKAAIEIPQRLRRLLLIFVLDVDIADHVISEIFTYLDVFDFTKLFQLFVNLFIEFIELQPILMLQQLSTWQTVKSAYLVLQLLRINRCGITAHGRNYRQRILRIAHQLHSQRDVTGPCKPATCAGR